MLMIRTSLLHPYIRTPRGFLPNHRLFSRKKLPRQKIIVKSSAGSGENDSGSGSTKWNPFTSNTSKQDAAKKALRDALSGKKDVLAQFDSVDEGSGGNHGGKVGSGGGDGDRWNWENWKNGFLHFVNALGEKLKGIGKTFGAIFFFVIGFVLIGMIGPLFSAISTFLKVLLRLEKVEDVFAPKKAATAGRERSVLFSDDEDDENKSSK